MELLKYINGDGLITNIIHLCNEHIVIHINSSEEFDDLMRELIQLDNVYVSYNLRSSGFIKYEKQLAVSIHKREWATNSSREFVIPYRAKHGELKTYNKEGYKVIEYKDIRGSLY